MSDPSPERDEIVDERGAEIERSDLVRLLSWWSGGAYTHVTGERKLLTAQAPLHML